MLVRLCLIYLSYFSALCLNAKTFLWVLSLTAEKFAQLQKAKEVLSDQVTRERYDKWLHSGIAIPYNEWCARQDMIHTVGILLSMLSLYLKWNFLLILIANGPFCLICFSSPCIGPLKPRRALLWSRPLQKNLRGLNVSLLGISCDEIIRHPHYDRPQLYCYSSMVFHFVHDLCFPDHRWSSSDRTRDCTNDALWKFRNYQIWRNKQFSIHVEQNSPWPMS